MTRNKLIRLIQHLLEEEKYQYRMADGHSTETDDLEPFPQNADNEALLYVRGMEWTLEFLKECSHEDIKKAWLEVKNES